MSEDRISGAIIPAAVSLPQVFTRRASAAVIVSVVTAAAVLSVTRVRHASRMSRALRHTAAAAAPPAPPQAPAEPDLEQKPPAHVIYRRVTVIEVWRRE